MLNERMRELVVKGRIKISMLIMSVVLTSVMKASFGSCFDFAAQSESNKVLKPKDTISASLSSMYDELTCKGELDDLCPQQFSNEQPIEEMFRSRICLWSNKESLSTTCSRYLVQESPSIIEPCLSEIGMFCSGVSPGYGHIHNCLSARALDISVRCSNALFEDILRDSQQFDDLNDYSSSQAQLNSIYGVRSMVFSPFSSKSADAFLRLYNSCLEGLLAPFYTFYIVFSSDDDKVFDSMDDMDYEDYQVSNVDVNVEDGEDDLRDISLYLDDDFDTIDSSMEDDYYEQINSTRDESEGIESFSTDSVQTHEELPKEVVVSSQRPNLKQQVEAVNSPPIETLERLRKSSETPSSLHPLLPLTTAIEDVKMYVVSMLSDLISQ